MCAWPAPRPSLVYATPPLGTGGFGAYAAGGGRRSLVGRKVPMVVCWPRVCLMCRQREPLHCHSTAFHLGECAIKAE